MSGGGDTDTTPYCICRQPSYGETRSVPEDSSHSTELSQVEPLTSLPSYLLRRRDGGVRKPRLPYRVVPPALRWPQLGSQGQVVLRGLPPLLHAVLKEVKEVEVSTASDLLLPRPLEFDALSANMDYEAFPGNHVHGVARGMARAS